MFGPMARVWRLLGLPTIVFLPIRASGETVAADFSLVMGDNDSRSDARNLCYINAKRRALEKAGVFIEAQTRVVNLVLKSQDVIAFTAAVARVEEGAHSFQVSGDQQVAKCTVRVTVDPADLKRRLAEYASDSGVRDRIRSQQQRIMELEGKIVSLSEALRSAGADQALVVRRE